MAISHFAFGASMTGLLFWLFCPRLRYGRSLVLLGGVWAMIPDAHHVTPLFKSQLRAIHDSQWMDLFWAHRFFDRVDPTDSAEYAMAMLGFLFVVSILLESRSDRPLPELVSSLGARNRNNPYWTALKRFAALSALFAGTAMLAVPLVRSQYLGLLVVSGSLLGLTGLSILREDRAIRTFTVRYVPLAVLTAAKLIVTFISMAIAIALLSTLPAMRELTFGYAALAMVLVIQLIRLWAPSDGNESGEGGSSKVAAASDAAVDTSPDGVAARAARPFNEE